MQGGDAAAVGAMLVVATSVRLATASTLTPGLGHTASSRQCTKYRDTLQKKPHERGLPVRAGFHEYVLEMRSRRISRHTLHGGDLVDRPAGG